MNAIYCGNIAEVADEIYLSEYFNLIEVIVEKGKISSEMLTFCYLRNIQFKETSDKKDLEKIVDAHPNVDFLLVCGFGIILSNALLSKVRAFNFHTGTLPNYKGRHPTFFATLAGEKQIGITLHEITPEIDQGRIIAIEKIKYRYNQTEIEIMNALPKAVERLLNKLIDYLYNKIQSHENIGGTYYAPVSENDISFSKLDQPSKILQIIRAQSRYEGGIFKNENESFRVKKIRVSKTPMHVTIQDNIIYLNGNLFGIIITREYCLEFIECLKIF